MVRPMLMWLLPSLYCLSPAVTTAPSQAQSSVSKSQAQPVQSSYLIDDARLSAPSSVEAVGVPLQELLKQVSHAHLTLKTDRFCAEQKIQLRLQKRPTRVLMQAIAELLPGTWEPLADKSGYILYMSPAAAHKRDKWWALFLQERAQELAALRAAALGAMRVAPYHRKSDDPNPEHSNLEVEAEIATHQGFFNALSPELQERIANNLNELQMNSRSNDLGFCEEEAVQVAFGDLPPAAQEMLQRDPSTRLFASKREVDWNNIMVRFNNTGYGIMSSIALPNGDATSTPLLHVPSEKSLALQLDHRGLADMVRRMGRAAPDVWKQLAAYQNSRVWPNASPKHLLRQGSPHRSDLLRRLSAQNDMEFVADYYSVPGLPLRPELASSQAATKQPLSPQALQETLDDAAALCDISWKQGKGGIYLFRNNRWYRDDLLEVSEALTRRWMTELAKPETQRNWRVVWTPKDIRAHMDWAADVVSNLTLWQIGSGMAWAADEDYLAAAEKSVSVSGSSPSLTRPFPFIMETVRLMGEYYTASFYAGLGKEQRDALNANHLSLAALTSAQQHQASKLVPRLRTLPAESASSIMLGLFSNIGTEQISPNNMPRVRLTIVSPVAP